MTDWASKWFEIRSDMGQSDLATMMFQDRGKPLTKVHFHHREADGFGKIQSLIKSEGLEITPPIRALKPPPNYLNFYLLIKSLIIHPRLPHNPWKYYSSDKPASLPDDVSYWILSTNENQKLKDLAKQKKLNLGFFIISEFDRIIKKQLYRNPEDKSTWLSPVDLRGAFPETKTSQNIVSFIVTDFKGNDDLDIQKSFENYKKDLKAGLYWAYWQLANIGQWIGIKGMKWLAQAGKNRSFWMGSFSDLGIWNQKNLINSNLKNRAWIMAPPGSASYPIGITTIEWCETRTITIKVHPSICKEHNLLVSDKILSEFKKQISNMS